MEGRRGAAFSGSVKTQGQHVVFDRMLDTFQKGGEYGVSSKPVKLTPNGLHTGAATCWPCNKGPQVGRNLHDQGLPVSR